MKAVIFVKESERLEHKHLLEICGEAMLSRVNRILKETGLFEDVLVFSKYERLQLTNIKVVNDSTEGILIDSIAKALETFNVFLAVGGDLPLIDFEVIHTVLEAYEGKPVAAVDVDGIVEPLFAIYNQSILDSLLKFSKQNRNIFPFITERFHLVHLNETQSEKLFNVNTKEDYETANRMIKCPKENSKV